MERRTVLGRLTWQLGEVVATQGETARAKSLIITVPAWQGHRPGQHVDVQLTAEDGYQAQRPLVFICGPTQLVETAAAGLLTSGYESARIKTERFGPTGGA